MRNKIQFAALTIGAAVIGLTANDLFTVVGGSLLWALVVTTFTS